MTDDVDPPENGLCFDELYRKHAPGMLYYARSRGVSGWDAQALVDDALLVAYQKYRPDLGSFGGFCWRIIRFRIQDWLKKAKRRPTVPLDAEVAVHPSTVDDIEFRRTLDEGRDALFAAFKGKRHGNDKTTAKDLELYMERALGGPPVSGAARARFWRTLKKLRSGNPQILELLREADARPAVRFLAAAPSGSESHDSRKR